MKIDGGCHCGAITYEAEVDPRTADICHCTDCQTLSGSVFRTVVRAEKASFRLHGEPRLYVKTAQSGNRRVQAFCGACGTPIYSAAEKDPQVFNIRLGTCRQRSDIVPQSQIWRRSALPWLGGLGALPGRETQ